MPSFAAAAKQANAERLPVVEGVTARIAVGEDAGAVAAQMQTILAAHLGGGWQIHPRPGGWLDALPLADVPPPLGRTWDAVRALSHAPGIPAAEPLLLLRVPTADAQEANARFGLWGIPYDRETEERLRRESAPRDWSLQQLKVPEAWAHWHQQHGQGDGQLPGRDVLIAHPDTGYVAHPQVDPVRTKASKNFVEADQPDDARDPLTATGPLEFPGHGCGTASVIASPTGEVAAARDVRGIAPGARIRPLRVSDSVIHVSFRNLVLALDDAIANGAHVVSMSLGGPVSSAALEDAVRRALDAGIILVAAAGNYLPTVVFPAALPGVIGCAASNAVVIPWRFSGFGDEVTITAPGERVWRATAGHDESGRLTTGDAQGNGTSHATAAVAGLAALWLSYHGRQTLLDRYGAPLLPFAFRLLLTGSANANPDFVAGGNGGFGAGIADALALLRAGLPDRAEVERHRDGVLNPAPGNPIGDFLGELVRLFRVPTRAPNGAPRLAAALPGVPGAPGRNAVGSLVAELLGGDPDDPAMVRELATLVASRPLVHRAMLGAAQQGEGARAANRKQEAAVPRTRTIIAVRERLLALQLSSALRTRLQAAQEQQRRSLPAGTSAEVVLRRFAPPPPPARRLRAFAFDPGRATRLATAVVNEVTIAVPFERDLAPGPVGEYLAIVDVDPATGCAYPPVDLNDPNLLAQDGLPRSEGNPQFHQQMVYAVAMKTIRHFVDALGRPIFWSPLRPWLGGNEAAWAESRVGPDGRRDMRDQFIRRLRIYPHALREANAYYSPAKRAILFGYFPAQEDDPGEEYPGGIVFTCLSHDIIAHEMTHAILDGMHVYFTEPTNPDVFAFHEAFADIVALFQHFTYPEVLRDQIARTRGDLTSENLLGQLAQQYGVATGEHHALRDAIGGVAVPVQPGDAQAMVDKAAQHREAQVTPAGKEGIGAPPPPAPRRWMRYQANPYLLPVVEESHARGAILVAAVFDAFLAIYARRIEDLTRIASEGTGVLREGQLPPDLVNRMAREAAKAADHVLRMCIRAMDYVPPVDITFGEFLRALITADFDLVADDDLRYRVAFIEAFRKWGIYPRNVRTLSEESLRWHSPESLNLFPTVGTERGNQFVRKVEQSLNQAVQQWRPNADRATIFASIQSAQAILNGYLRGARRQAPGPDWARTLMPGIDLDKPFRVANLRPARRIGPGNEFRTELVFEVVQTISDLPEGERDGLPFYAAVTVIVSLDDWHVRYSIYKRGVEGDALNRDRFLRQRRYERQRAAALGAAALGAAEYRCDDADDALPERTDDGEALRAVHREAMRADSCRCRARRIKQREENDDQGLAGPFALLHRGRG